MTTFEERCAPTQAVKDQFQADCHEIFGFEAGKRVLHRLCQACHPLGHLPGMTDHQHGNAEVVALLWRYGAHSPALPEPTTNE